MGERRVEVFLENVFIYLLYMDLLNAKLMKTESYKDKSSKIKINEQFCKDDEINNVLDDDDDYMISE